MDRTGFSMDRIVEHNGLSGAGAFGGLVENSHYVDTADGFTGCALVLLPAQRQLLLRLQVSA